MPDFLYRYLLHFDNFLRTSSLPGWRATAKFLASRFGNSPEKKLQAAANYLMHQVDGVYTKSALRQATESAARAARQRPGVDDASIIRSAVVKSCKSAAEPGILLVSFETELRKVLSLRRYDNLVKNYRICFMPTWQNFFCPEVVELDVRATEPYYLLPSSFDEMELRPLLGPYGRILPFHAASWVNQALYCSSPVIKDIDIIMLANFNRLKRHWKLFQAIASLPKHLQIVLIGVPLHNRDKNSLLKEARLFGVADRVTILENASRETLQNSLERAKLMCALSHREGSYVGVAEALMADTPVAMFGNAMIGTKTYINENTGFLLDPRHSLAGQLAIALERAESLQPRAWARANISANSNCRRFNACLKEDYLAGGHEWTEDIANFYCVRFELYYVDQADSSTANVDEEYVRIERDFGLKIERPREYPVEN